MMMLDSFFESSSASCSSSAGIGARSNALKFSSSFPATAVMNSSVFTTMSRISSVLPSVSSPIIKMRSPSSSSPSSRKSATRRFASVFHARASSLSVWYFDARRNTSGDDHISRMTIFDGSPFVG